MTVRTRARVAPVFALVGDAGAGQSTVTFMPVGVSDRGTAERRDALKRTPTGTAIGNRTSTAKRTQ